MTGIATITSFILIVLIYKGDLREDLVCTFLQWLLYLNLFTGDAKLYLDVPGILYARETVNPSCTFTGENKPFNYNLLRYFLSTLIIHAEDSQSSSHYYCY